jgi:PEP-CTERM motif
VTTALGANRSAMTFFDAVISGPSSFGAGPGAFADRINGSPVVVSLSFIGVPRGYVSGAPLRDTTSWIGATYDSLGMTPGVYTWNWGSGADADSITFDIVAPVFAADGTPIANNSILAELPLPTEFTFPLTLAAPEPSTWAMMLIGFVGLGYAAVRRKGAVRTVTA